MAIFIYHNVFWLEVSMDYFAIMEMLNSKNNFGQIKFCLLLRQVNLLA